MKSFRQIPLPHNPIVPITASLPVPRGVAPEGMKTSLYRWDRKPQRNDDVVDSIESECLTQKMLQLLQRQC